MLRKFQFRRVAIRLNNYDQFWMQLVSCTIFHCVVLIRSFRFPAENIYYITKAGLLYLNKESWNDNICYYQLLNFRGSIDEFNPMLSAYIQHCCNKYSYKPYLFLEGALKMPILTKSIIQIFGMSETSWCSQWKWDLSGRLDANVHHPARTNFNSWSSRKQVGKYGF